MLHIFTIVINGMPFIKRHLETFEKLSMPWHWHIVEGVADLQGCTGWSKARGGRVPNLHRNYLSIDGTTEYLDSIRKHHNVSVYSTPWKLWSGKIEMVNLPLKYMDTPGVLLEVDADEFWTVEQLERIYATFNSSVDLTAMWFRCRFWVGPNLRLQQCGGYADNAAYEWVRAWSFKPGMQFWTHEPPRLVIPGIHGDRASVKPMRRDETQALGLVFEHYAYLTELQVAWKEIYYGYSGAVESWHRLQLHAQFPVEARQFMPWVYDGTPIVRDTMPHSF